MFGFAAECFLRATLLVAGVWCALTALRVTNPRVRHLAWTAATAAMLTIPFLNAAHLGAHLSIALPTFSEDIASSRIGASASQAIHSTESNLRDAPLAGVRTGTLVIGFYALAGLVLLARLLLGTLRARRVIRTAQSGVIPEDHAGDGFLFHESCASPVTVGWWRPRILLPPGFPQWPADRRRAALIHEREHLRWRDPLAQWMALLNRSLFWIHPATWWIERHLADLAEDACDRAVLDQGCSAVDYAGLLLDCAGSLHGPAVRFGMGIEGRGLARRIPRILAARAPKSGWQTQVRAAAALVLCAGVALCSAGLSLHPVFIPIFARASARTAFAPLPITILGTANLSLTAVADPAVPLNPESEAAFSLPLPTERSQRTTFFYFNLDGMNHESRLVAVGEASAWLSRRAPQPRDRAFAIIVRRSGQTEVIQDPSSDIPLVTSRLQSLNSLDYGDSIDSAQQRIEAIKSVVQSLLPTPGVRDLVCIPGSESAITEIRGDLSHPPLNLPVRFVPSNQSD